MTRAKLRDFLAATYGTEKYNEAVNALHTLYKLELLDQDTWEYITEIDLILFRAQKW